MIRRNQNNRLVEYLATACTNTGQATFYNTRAEQAAALAALHAEILASDRRVYALSAALPINDRNRQLVLQNLLATGRDVTDRELENLVVAHVTRELPFNRALNLLVDLCRAKVNNARLRRVCRLLWNQYADAYRVIKYRTKFRTLLRHCHISEGDEPRRAELHRWLFGRLRDAAAVRHNALLRMRLLAARDVQHCYQLPLDIGHDIAVNCHGMKASDFTRNYVGKDGQQGHGRATRKETTVSKKP